MTSASVCRRWLLAGSALLLAIVGCAIPAAGATSAPRPVGYVGLSSSSHDDGATWQVFVFSDYSLDTRYSRVCWSAGVTPPATPRAAAGCGPIQDGGQYFDVRNGRRYSVSVFAYSKASGLYSKPKSRTFTAHTGASTPSAGESYGTGADSWYLEWPNDPAVTAWTISIHEGTDPSPASAELVATIPPRANSFSTAYELTGLIPDTTYTVFIEPEGPTGPLALPDAETISAHVGGGYLTTTGAASAFQERLPGSGAVEPAAMTAVRAVGTPSGRIDAAFANGLDAMTCHCDTSNDIFYVSRTDGQWSEPVMVGSTFQARDVAIGSGGNVTAVAWDGVDLQTDRDTVYLRVSKDGSWLPVQHFLEGATNPTVLSLVVDGAGHVHMVLLGGGERLYITDASGVWTSSRLPIAGLLSYDREADRIILAGDSRTNLTTTYYVGSVPASATTFPSLSRRYSMTGIHVLDITGVASSGRRITVTFDRALPPWDGRSGVFFMSGLGAAHVGGLTRVHGTGRFARDLAVTAPAPGQVQFAWSTALNDFAPWQHAGIYTARRSLGADGHWRANTPTQRTSGRDDVNPQVFRQPDGTAAVVFEKALVFRTDRFDD